MVGVGGDTNHKPHQEGRERGRACRDRENIKMGIEGAGIWAKLKMQQ